MPILVAALGVGAVLGVLTGFIWEPIRLIAEAMAGLADVVVEQLPDAADLGLDASGGWIKGYALLNTFLPITEALAFVMVFVGVHLAALALKLAVLVYHLIPKPGMGT